MTKRRRHVHLGERLDLIERIRASRLTAEQAADEAGVSVEEVQMWMQIHADDRIVALDDTRVSPEVRRLSKRAERLVELIANADLTIRILNRMLSEVTTVRPPAHHG
jgi:hypothetical protein